MESREALNTDMSRIVILNQEEELSKHRRYWALRRTQDILISFLALIILAPFLLVIAIIIYIDDPHCSPIYSQIRCGRNCKKFRMYKFRTMCVDAEDKLVNLLTENEMDGPVFKIKNDPRITRAGKFLRRTSIDELPQLINVLKGDMSIVGPRPALPRETELYNDYQRQRMYVTPGLTCYWQIQPNRNGIPFDEWIELDIRYIQERSLRVDWKIILMTIGAVFRGHGE